MNRNKRYYDSKKGLQDRIKELEMEVQRLTYINETARTILNQNFAPSLTPIPDERETYIPPVSRKSTKSPTTIPKVDLGKTHVDTYTPPQPSPKPQQQPPINTPAPRKEIPKQETFDEVKPEVKPPIKETVQEQPQPPPPPPPQEQKQEKVAPETSIPSDLPTDEKGNILCHCGQIAVATKKMSDGT